MTGNPPSMYELQFPNRRFQPYHKGMKVRWLLNPMFTGEVMEFREFPWKLHVLWTEKGVGVMGTVSKHGVQDWVLVEPITMSIDDPPTDGEWE